MIECASMERENVIAKHDILKHEAHEKIVQPFLKDAFKEGAHKIKPKHISADQWFKQLMTGVVYNDKGSSATLEELAEKDGVPYQTISLRNKSFLRNLWNNCSRDIQEQYRLNELLSALKPWSQKSKERASVSKGGASLIIREQVRNGVTDVKKISENTGISASAIIALRGRTLKGWGVNVSRKNRSRKETLK